MYYNIIVIKVDNFKYDLILQKNFFYTKIYMALFIDEARSKFPRVMRGGGGLS